MVVTLAEFRSSITGAAPPAGLAPPLAALWWTAKGNWDKAHQLVQDDAGVDAAWVHAYLHRVEGDLPNARYWYGAAGRSAASETLDDEWTAIVTALLS